MAFCLSIHQFADIWIVSPLFALMNNAAMSTCTKVCVHVYLGMELLGYIGILCLSGDFYIYQKDKEF